MRGAPISVWVVLYNALFRVWDKAVKASQRGALDEVPEFPSSRIEYYAQLSRWFACRCASGAAYAS